MSEKRRDNRNHILRESEYQCTDGSENPEWAWYENYLHAARMNLLMLGMAYNEALDFVNRNDTLGT